MHTTMPRLRDAQSGSAIPQSAHCELPGARRISARVTRVSTSTGYPNLDRAPPPPPPPLGSGDTGVDLETSPPMNPPSAEPATDDSLVSATDTSLPMPGRGGFAGDALADFGYSATDSAMTWLFDSNPAMAVLMASIHRALSAWFSACRQYSRSGDTTLKQNRMFGESSRSGLIVAVSSRTVSFASPNPLTSLSR